MFLALHKHVYDQDLTTHYLRCESSCSIYAIITLNRDLPAQDNCNLTFAGAYVVKIRTKLVSRFASVVAVPGTVVVSARPR